MITPTWPTAETDFRVQGQHDGKARTTAHLVTLETKYKHLCFLFWWTHVLPLDMFKHSKI